MFAPLLLTILMNGTITVHVRNTDSGATGVYVQRAHNAPVNVNGGILGYEAPAEYSVRGTEPPCTAHYGDATTPVSGSIYLTATAQKEFLGMLVMPGQLLGGGESSGPMCATGGFGAHLQTGLVAPPKLPGAHHVTHWTFHLRNVHDQTPGVDYIYDWDVNLTFTNK
jgi:hypothetical protein